MDTVDPLKLHNPIQGADGAFKHDQTDFCIKVEDSTIPVNKDYMCTVSEYFRGMVESGMTENKDGLLDVKDTKPQVVQTVVKYLYGEKVSIPWDDVKDYVDFVELWQILELKSSLDNYIWKHVSPNNCIEWYHIADVYHMETVKSEVKEILASDFKDVLKGEYFKGLEYEELVAFLKNKELCVSPDDALEAAIHWTMADESTRRSLFEDLLTYVMISKCNPARLKYLLDKCHLVTSQSVSAKINDVITSSIILFINGFDFQLYDPIPAKAQVLNINDFSNADISKSFPHLPINQPWMVNHSKTTAGIFSTWPDTTNQTKCVLWDPASLAITQLPPISKGSVIVRNSNAALVNNNMYTLLCHMPPQLVRINTHSCIGWNEILLPESMKTTLQNILCTHGKCMFVLSRDVLKSKSQLHCYDTEHNTWTEKASPDDDPCDLIQLKCVFSGLDHLYVIGNIRKMDNGEMQGLESLFLCYHIASDTWTKPSRPRKKNTWANAVFLDTRGEIYAFVPAGNRCIGRIQVYNIAADEWKEISCNIPIDIEKALCFTV